jgi:hypothetical protein
MTSKATAYYLVLVFSLWLLASTFTDKAGSLIYLSHAVVQAVTVVFLNLIEKTKCPFAFTVSVSILPFVVAYFFFS